MKRLVAFHRHHVALDGEAVKSNAVLRSERIVISILLYFGGSCDKL